MANPPQVQCASVHPTLGVRSLSEAMDFFTRALGFSAGFTWGDPPRFAGVDLGETRIFLRSEISPAPSSVSFVVDQVDALYAFHQAAGVPIVETLEDREYGMRDYRVEEPNGHQLTFGQPIYSIGEPIPIERVEVTVRLERRLGALLADLAAHKHMSIGEALEEMLLHTSEPLENYTGVASPHTAATLRYIQQLKEKHGIDYDTHASYRFVEANP